MYLNSFVIHRFLEGKYFLKDASEITAPGSFGHPQPRTAPRPSTPPPVSSHSSGPTRSRVPKNDPDRTNQTTTGGAAVRDTSRIYVSQTVRINPHRLIKELTERGVTGAYLADSQTATHMAQRFAMFDLDRDADSVTVDGDDFILFVSSCTV